MYNTSPVPYAIATIVVIGILIASIFGIASETDREKERAAENTTANEFVLVDTDIDTAEVGRYHHYSTILKFCESGEQERMRAEAVTTKGE